MIEQAVLLVGGRGERLNDRFRYSPVVEVPKPLVEVGGRPFLTYAINMLRGIGFKDIVLLVGHKKEYFEFLEDEVVRLVVTQENVNEAVLSIPDLQDLFLLLNGDCFPVMDWRTFVQTDTPRTAIKIVGRDAGVAVVLKPDVENGFVDCSKIGNMADRYENYTILGGLHIGTYQGLARARQFMDLVVFGA